MNIILLYLLKNKEETKDYKQGIHELVAIFYYINNKKSNNIESVTFIMFEEIMKDGIEIYYYDINKLKENIDKMYKTLKTNDKEVYIKLNELNIEPQIFAVRWFRLLFSREFKLEQSLLIMDFLVQNNKTILESVVYFGVSMICFLKKEILSCKGNSDDQYSSIVHRLLNFGEAYSTNEIVEALIENASRIKNIQHQGTKAPTSASNQDVSKSYIMVDKNNGNDLCLTQVITKKPKPLASSNSNSTTNSPVSAKSAPNKVMASLDRCIELVNVDSNNISYLKDALSEAHKELAKLKAMINNQSSK